MVVRRVSAILLLQGSVKHVHEKLINILEACEKLMQDYELTYEVLAIDYANQVSAYREAKAVASTDPHVRPISFAYPKSMDEGVFYGLEQATGEYVFVSDCDTENLSQTLYGMICCLVDHRADAVVREAWNFPKILRSYEWLALWLNRCRLDQNHVLGVFHAKAIHPLLRRIESRTVFELWYALLSERRKIVYLETKDTFVWSQPRITKKGVWRLSRRYRRRKVEEKHGYGKEGE